MMKLLKYVVLGIALTTNTGLYAQEIELAQQLLQNHNNHQLIPLIYSSHPNLSVEQAYLVQQSYVKKRLAGTPPAGFKAGLTSKAGQQKFHLTQALTGVLFTGGDLTTAPPIQLSQFKRLMLESEVGFEIGKAITGLVANPTQLQQSIKAVFPVIELPELGFAGKPTGVDIIAANVGSSAYIKGKPITQFTDWDLNALQVTMTHDGKTVNMGQGSDALGNQWQAALWLVNTVVAQGWTLEPGQFLITGAMGQMIPAKPGNYHADFGELGQISFSIVR